MLGPGKKQKQKQRNTQKDKATLIKILKSFLSFRLSKQSET